MLESKTNAMWLNKLALENFKSHTSGEIDFGKITVLIGQNNAGKSSILQSLILLAQSTKQNQRQLVTKNNIIDLGEYADIVSLGDEKKSISITIQGREKIELGGNYGGIIESEYANYFFKVSAKENDIHEIYFYVKSDHTEIDFRSTPQKTSGTLRRLYENKSWDLNFTSTGNIIPSLTVTEASPEINRKFNDEFQGKFLKNIFNRFYYIPFHRTIGKFGVDITQKRSVDNIVTSDPETTSSALLSTLGKDRKLRQKVSDLYATMYQESMSPHNLDPDFYEQEKRDVERISLMFSKGEFASSIANEGGGINQLVLLFTILSGSPRGSIICLEAPEIHLHPAMQSVLMKQILKVLKDEDKQIILTTHSEYILYPLLAAVSKGELQPNDLVIHYFQFDRKKNESLIEKLDVNDKGQIKGGLKGFWDATVEAMSDLVGSKNAK